ncbi:MAG: exopolysaccharide transport family protein, partial [Myxococcota bacterium]
MQLAPSQPPANHDFALEAEGGLDLRQILQLVLRRKWVIAATVAASVLIGALVTIRAPKVYQASSKVLIELNTPRYLDDEVGEVYDPGAYGYLGLQQYYKTQYDIIKGQPVAERVVAMLGIDGGALADALRAEGAASVEDQVAGDPLAGVEPALRNKIELVGLAGLASREDILTALEDFDAIEFAQAKVTISSAEDSRIVKIQVADTDPERAALFANAITDAYAEYNLDLRTTAARSAVDWLSGQLSDLKRKLEEAEFALYEFKKENNIISVSLEDRQSMISQTLSELNSRLSETRARRIELEALRDQSRRARNDGLTPESLESVSSSTVVQNLKQSISALKQERAELATRYTAKHPKRVEIAEKVEALESELKSEIDGLLTAAEERYRAAQDTEIRLRNAIEKTKGEALEVNKKEIDYTRLQREAKNYASLYDLVLKRQKETDLTTLLNVNNVRKFEAAKPPKAPIKPRPVMNMLVSLVLGVLAGVGLAFLVDMFDNTVKSQKQVEETLGIPFLGIVPMIKVGRGPRNANNTPERDQYILENPRSAVAECTRTIRTNLMFMATDRPMNRLLFTSARPSEGKTTTAISVGVSMAQAGNRVLLLD